MEYNHLRHESVNRLAIALSSVLEMIRSILTDAAFSSCRDCRVGKTVFNAFFIFKDCNIPS